MKFNNDGHVLFKRIQQHCNASHIVDIGCGIRPQTLVEVECTLVEPCPAYADWLEEQGKQPVRMTALEYLRAAHRVDCVMLLDVIEHMQKDEGLEVIRLLQDKARQAFVFTPYGFYPLEEDVWGFGAHEYQRHKSGWLPEDFPGWTVFVEEGAILAVWGTT